jgi:nickel transport protein
VSNSGLFFAAALLLPEFLFAHGVEVSEVEKSAKVVRFSYSDGEPMMYAKVMLYSPSSAKVETLKSLTDKNGVFAFVADEKGEWRVAAQDGLGHKGEIVVNALEISANAEVKQSAKNTQNASKLFRVILGLSLLINIFVIYGFALKKP